MRTEEKLAFSSLPLATRLIWAKSGEGTGHSLLAHMLDVAAVAETILSIEPPSTLTRVSAETGLASAGSARWLAALSGLHDFGKAIPGFQAKWPEGQQQVQAHGFAFPQTALGVADHALATAALLEVGLCRVSGAARFWCLNVLQAISAHHGYHYLPDQIRSGRPRNEPAEWGQARDVMLRTYWDTLMPHGTPAAPSLTLPTVSWLAGLTSVADWIASNPTWFPLGERCDDLPAYYAQACNLAAEALRQIGWTSASNLLTGPADTDALLAQIVQRQGLSARPLQKGADQLLQETRGPVLLLVEAPMGEGKTELAFLAHLRLQAANGHRGLFVALPTQATGNAMFRRALTFLRGFSSGPMDVQLVHGGAAMNEDLHALRGIDHSQHESLSASAWFAQRRRPLLSPYGVGTVDQALYAVLNVKHHFVRLWGLSNRVVVLDEVHAYDTYTSGLMAMLLRWLRALGCSVVLMSATLPRARRDELLRAWGVDCTNLPALAYPRLVLADDAGPRGLNVHARPLPAIQLAGLDESIEGLADQALQLLVEGGCGALIVNTVDRAQNLLRVLRERLDNGHDSVTQLLLFHARFPADERGEIEQRVLTLFGPDGERPKRALLIATQVAEQSLDIDFDFMLSDLAPVDLLLQRAGRLHRHIRSRPARHSEARLWVAGLQRERLPELKKTAWGFVYDAYILGRTWALLGQESQLQLPADIDRLVQAVYDTDTPLPDALEDAARDFIEIESYGAYLARVKKERQQSFNAAIHPDSEPQQAYEGKPKGHAEDETGLGIENRTRLGPESITLVPVHIGENGRWHVQLDDRGFAPDQPVSDDMARQLYGRQLKLTRTAVVKHFHARERPPAFAEHALLQNFHPLPLREGRYAIGGTELRLDPALGLVIERKEISTAPPQGAE